MMKQLNERMSQKHKGEMVVVTFQSDVCKLEVEGCPSGCLCLLWTWGEYLRLPSLLLSPSYRQAEDKCAARIFEQTMCSVCIARRQRLWRLMTAKKGQVRKH